MYRISVLPFFKVLHEKLTNTEQLLCCDLQKWSKGKVRDKLNNLVLFDKATYDKLYKEVPNYKLITPSVVSERLKIRGSLARAALIELHQKGNTSAVRHSYLSSASLLFFLCPLFLPHKSLVLPRLALFLSDSRHRDLSQICIGTANRIMYVLKLVSLHFRYGCS